MKYFGLSLVGLILILSLPRVVAPAAQHDRHVMVNPDGIKWAQNSVVLSGDPRKEGAPFVLRLKFADGAKIPPHWHPIDEHVTVISGTFFMGQGEEFDESKAHEMKTGAYGLMPKEVRHFAWVKGETVIQIHGLGPFITNWVKPPAKLTSSAAPRVKLNFTPESEKFAAATEEYRNIWQAEGNRMIAVIEEVSGLKYHEAEVNAIVFEGPSESGYQEKPMKMRASYPTEIKKEALLHEIGHRHLSQLRHRPKDIDEHRLLFLWLYDAWVKLYGQGFAENAVKVEAARKGIYDYEGAWKWALAMTPAERAAKWKEVLRQN